MHLSVHLQHLILALFVMFSQVQLFITQFAVGLVFG